MDQVSFTQTLRKGSSTLEDVIDWVNNFSSNVQTSSARNLIQDVGASGAKLSTIVNASANQVPYYTGPAAVALLTLSAFAKAILQTCVTGTVTLTAGATATTVTAAGCTASSFVHLAPQTQHAANDGATTSWVAGSGQFVITHANNARTDRTFSYIVLGA
jgi:hypothetical protein